MNTHRLIAVLGALCVPAAAHATGDPARGEQAFRACAACHSLAPGEHRTGPSLASVFDRRAGTAKGFDRYSQSMRQADLVWNEQTLDAFLRDPAAFVPGTAMGFRGIADAGVRRDLVAYLRAVSAGELAAPEGGGLPDLKAFPAEQRVSAIRHCRDAYHVTLGDGKIYPFWEFNLRFKTDSSARGPRRGEPVILGTGMGGDRAQVVFAAPEEISRFIRSECR